MYFIQNSYLINYIKNKNNECILFEILILLIISKTKINGSF